MHKAVIWQTKPFTLTSYGNGTAYSLVHDDGRSVFVQGDDATQFYIDAFAADTLAELWALYEDFPQHTTTT